MPTLIKCDMHPDVPPCVLALLQQWPIHSLLYVSCAMLRHCLPYAQPSTLCHCLGGSQRQQYNAKAGAQTPLLLAKACAGTCTDVQSRQAHNWGPAARKCDAGTGLSQVCQLVCQHGPRSRCASDHNTTQCGGFSRCGNVCMFVFKPAVFALLPL